MLIDSHCHLDRLNLEPYDGNLELALTAARDRGVGEMLCIAISLENREAVLKIAEQSDNVWASVGVHPLDVDSGVAGVEALCEWGKHNKVVALGETGLDYYYSKESVDLQKSSFIAHLQAGKASSLPIVVHTRDAKQDTLDLIRQEGCLESSGVLHCFTEDWDMAKQAIDLNYCISISGIVTFRNAEALRDTVKKLPLDALLVETDSPYLAPVPYRGKPNEPKYVREVAEFIAELKGVSYEQLLEVTANNFRRLFKKTA